MSTGSSTAQLPRRAVASVKHRVEEVVGGPTRTRIVAVFACVLGLESADATAVGAAAPQLEASLHISNTQLGLLAAVSTGVAALATIPAGALTDRVNRVRLLSAAVALWGVAMVASAAAQDYTWLLLCRVGLGVVIAAAGPVVASLTGNFFAAAERARIYGYILSGELLGAGIGFVVSGSLAGAASWRWAFLVLAFPAALLAASIWRRLPEPARGGQSCLAKTDPGQGEDQEPLAQRAVEEHDVRPAREHVLRSDLSSMKLHHAILYVLRIRTNRWLIAATAVGYFFFAGMRTFGVVFVRSHFSVSQGAATAILFAAGLGSLAGVLLAGRFADRLIRRGLLTGRILVGAGAYLLAPVLLLPALLVGSLGVALPLLVLSAAALGAPNPPLDAARLDIVPARLWGRAEGVRTFLRQAAQAGAPLLFGLVADLLGGGGSSGSNSVVSPTAARALQYTFLIMLIPLALNGVMLLGARRSYAPDVATAAASEPRTESE